LTKLAETERASGQSQPLSAAKAQTLVPGLLKRTLSYAISRQTSVRFPMSNFICSAASEAGRVSAAFWYLVLLRRPWNARPSVRVDSMHTGVRLRLR
jgi:hypothetical protein